MGYRVAVVGATGAVGHEMLSILSEREFAIDEIHALASNRSEGKEINFGDKKLLFLRVDEKQAIKMILTKFEILKNYTFHVNFQCFLSNICKL